MKTRTQKTENRKQKFAKLFAFLLFAVHCLLVADIAIAAGGVAQETTLMDWVWKIVNFAVLMFLLIKFVAKPLKGFLNQRRELIEKSIREAQEAKELAKKALAEVEERLKMKDKEIEDIISSAQSSGEKEKARLIEEGERLKLKILEQAKTNIDYEVKKAKEAIKAEAVEAAMQLAEEKIKNKITKAEQEKLVEESLKLLGGRN